MSYLCLVSAQEDLGYFPSLVVGRSGIDGCSEDVILETVRQCTLLVADHTWYESYHGIRYDGSCQFASCQHIVAHGDLSGDEVVAHTLVDTFVMSTQNDEIALHRHLVGYLLVEGLSIRRHVDDIIVVAFSLQGRDATVDRFTLHHHAGASTVWIVVYTFPFVECIVSQVVQMNLCQSFLLCTGQDGFSEKSLQHFG